MFNLYIPKFGNKSVEDYYNDMFNLYPKKSKKLSFKEIKLSV